MVALGKDWLIGEAVVGDFGSARIEMIHIANMKTSAGNLKCLIKPYM
jgi:hypothetical protein